MSKFFNELDFDDDSPKIKNTEIEQIYENQRHYLKLIKNYKEEIKFIYELQKNLRDEQIKFCDEIFPAISEKFEKNIAIDEEIKKMCLQDLYENMQRSFSLSDSIITAFITKKLEEFDQEVKKILNE